MDTRETRKRGKKNRSAAGGRAAGRRPARGVGGGVPNSALLAQMGELSGESAHGEGEIEAQILGRVSGLARSGQPQLPRAEEAAPAPAEEAAPAVAAPLGGVQRKPKRKKGRKRRHKKGKRPVKEPLAAPAEAAPAPEAKGDASRVDKAEESMEPSSFYGGMSATDLTGVGPASNEWWGVVLPTVQEFRDSVGTWEADKVKNIEKGLTELQSRTSRYDLGRMTDRVDIYGALDWVSQACDDYLGKQEGEEETKRQVEALAEGVRKKMESLRGGAYARAFQMAALQYDMERHAEGGMGKEAFHQRYFSHKDDGDMKEAPAQTYYLDIKNTDHWDLMSNISSAYGEVDTAIRKRGPELEALERKGELDIRELALKAGDDQEERDDKKKKDNRPYIQANAILGAMRREELGDIQKRFQKDELMGKLMEEIAATQDKIHYTVAGSIPMTTIARYGRSGSRYVLQSRLFDPNRFYGDGVGAFPKSNAMDLIHESTHAVVGETFHGVGRNFTVPVQELGQGSKEQKERAMEELKKVVHERNETSDAIFRLAEAYLSYFRGGMTGPAPAQNIWPGWSRRTGELAKIRQQAGYNYGLQREMEKDKNRVAITCQKFAQVRKALDVGHQFSEHSLEASHGYVEAVRDERWSDAYSALGQAREETEKKKAEAPYGRFTNSIVEYDSTMNECYYICKEIGVPESDPLMGMIRAATQDAYEYRKRYREEGEFTSVTTHKARHRLAPP